MVFISTDIDDIAKILNHPKVFEWLGDDLSPSPFVPVLDGTSLYVMNEEKTGLIIVEPLNGITCQVHTAVLPKLWGRADGFVKEVMAWVFTNTLYQKAITFIPDYNRPAIQLAKRVGMVEEGRIKKSFLKKWKLHNQYLYGLTKKSFKEELSCQQRQE